MTIQAQGHGLSINPLSPYNGGYASVVPYSSETPLTSAIAEPLTL